jgi:hypothetical protein
VLIAKQTLGERLSGGLDVTPFLPPELIPIPSRFLRAHRDHPRLSFVAGAAWFIADTHEKNLAYDLEGRVRVIDLLAARWPERLSAVEPVLTDWLNRAQIDPGASVLAPAADDEL